MLNINQRPGAKLNRPQDTAADRLVNAGPAHARHFAPATDCRVLVVRSSSGGIIEVLISRPGLRPSPVAELHRRQRVNPSLFFNAQVGLSAAGFVVVRPVHRRPLLTRGRHFYAEWQGLQQMMCGESRATSIVLLPRSGLTRAGILRRRLVARGEPMYRLLKMTLLLKAS